MSNRPRLNVLAASMALALAALTPWSSAHASTWNTLDGAAPIVIGHRGASGYLPEHTLAAYERAVDLGADFIEPDLVMTRDGILVARHEPVIGSTTNVAALAQFADRRTTKVIDGVTYANEWFVEDFTLAELKQLRAIQTRGRDASNDGQFEVPTLDEVIALAQRKSVETGRTIGIYPELKHSTYMSGVSQAQGRSASYFEDTLVSTLHGAYGNAASAPVFIQSFETANLKYLNGVTDIRLVQLVDANDVNADGSMDLTAPYDQPFDIKNAGGTTTFADLLTPEGLAAIAVYADGVGPWKPWLVTLVNDGMDRDGDGDVDVQDRRVDGSTGVIETAHELGLLVHTWTFRDDAGIYGFASPEEEMAYYMHLGVDGVFTDFPDTGVAARAIAAVPEPQTWALMLAGVGVAGVMARRQRR